MPSDLIKLADDARRWVFNVDYPDGGRRASTPEEIQRMLLEAADRSEYGGVTDAQALRVAAVFACVNLLSRSVAMLPCGLYRIDGEKHVSATEHPVHRLLTVGPNVMQSPFELWQMLVAHVLLKGNFYAKKIYSGRKLTALLWLDPSRVEPVLSTSGELAYKYRRSDDTSEYLLQKQVFHVRNLCVDGVKGLSTLHAAGNSINFAVRAERHGGSMFANGARPSGILQTDKQLNDAAFRRLREDFEAKYVGEENAHRPMILEDGLKWQTMSMTAEDTQFIEQRKFARSEIAMFFQVPPHAIGDIERGTSWGSGIEQQNMGFLVHVLRPHLVNIQQACVRDLLEPEDQTKYVVKFDTSVLERADFVSRQTGLQIQKMNGIINADEWRQIEGRNPLDTEESERYAADAAPAAGRGTEAQRPA